MAEARQGLDWNDYQRIADATARISGTLEPEDVSQEVFIALWEAQPGDEKLARVIAWRARSDYWKHLQYRISHRNLSEPLSRFANKEGDPSLNGLTLADNIMGDDGSAAETAAMLGELPAGILAIGRKRTNDFPLSAQERQQLHRFRLAYAA